MSSIAGATRNDLSRTDLASFDIARIAEDSETLIGKSETRDAREPPLGFREGTYEAARGGRLDEATT